MQTPPQECASGGRWDRPELQLMLDRLREGDNTIVVWKLDRLSRSLKDVLLTMEKIEAAGAGFRSQTEAIDTTTPANRREHPVRPQDRRRYGSALRHQPAHRFPDRG